MTTIQRSTIQPGMIQPITMPKWGIEMQQGTVTAWHKSLGETVRRGDDLVDIETDKIVNTVESPVSGVLRRILADDGDEKSVGELIGICVEGDPSEHDIDAFIASFKPADASFEPSQPSEPASNTAAEDASGAAAATPPAAMPASISPIARRVAEKLGVNLAGITGTGRNGRVSKQDVEEAARAQGLLADEPDQTPQFDEIRLSGMQKTAARRLTQAKQDVPHFYLELDADASRLQSAAQAAGVSVNVALAKALAMALAAVPDSNVQWVDDRLRKFRTVDIGIAVATRHGLVAPVLRDVAQMTLAALSDSISKLVAAARDRRLKATELEGGVTTLSNLGMFGVRRFSAIINPPQTSILAVGAVRDSVTVIDGQPAVRPTMSATLSCDHRAIDGALAAQLAGALKSAIETGLESTA